ncbi:MULTISPECIES: hypothetical protein [Arthrobacter]|uniref:Lipoprotein n=2 Tax=Arthrobacter TaxID=1663 RepID=A0ABU9KM23_9MICC|nr:hypothetical protein [Arthrobacter sp. YJM1]MDP5228118.1 hypothetical protein [Arthrobacter sp. YJM1]
MPNQIHRNRHTSSRRHRAALPAALALTLLALTACQATPPTSGGGERSATSGSTSGSTPGTSATAIAVGKGPQSPYTVQQQPAPGSCQYRYTADKQPLPDPKCTPGALNPKVTQENLKTTICRTGGYTSDIRPPVNITGREKDLNAKSYSFKGSLSEAEYDHLISLQLGGDPNDPRNLWVQPPSPGHDPSKGVNNDKDPVESKLAAAVCKGTISLSDAQIAIATDWTTALKKLGLG